MGSKNKDKSKSKKKKDKKHKKSKKAAFQDPDKIIDMAKSKSEIPIEDKKKEIDDVIAG